MHVASSVLVSCAKLRVALKKEDEVCSSSENGRQSWNVSSPRKLLKNLGQLGEVKLFPRLLSKGCGRDVGVDVDSLPPLDVVADDAGLLCEAVEVAIREKEVAVKGGAVLSLESVPAVRAVVEGSS